MDYNNASLTLVSSEVKPGAIRWRSPSNIALVKYWGKHGDQLPKNPSVSFTLDGAATDTTLHYELREIAGAGVPVKLFLDGEENEQFGRRTAQFFERLLPIYPFLKQLAFRIDTTNSFPHSAGIASSASGMSALALCLLSLEETLFSPLDRREFLRKASYLARLGSGSACRSVYGGVSVWGKLDGVPESDELFAVPVSEQIHETFKDYHDDILLISKSEKSVSSRAGHGLMEGNPYAPARYQQARQHAGEILNFLRRGDVEAFGELLENEALTLHALMLSSRPPYLLMRPNTVAVIEKIQRYRREEGVPVYFTLDAGPNLHLLYPDAFADKVKAYVRSELLTYCEDGMYLADRVGSGPKQLEVSI